MVKKKARIYFQDIGVVIHFLIMLVALVVGVIYFDTMMALVFVAGWVSYIVQEHLVHRFVFHAPAPKNQFWFNVLYRLHYGHHDQIHNVHLLFTPLWFSLALGVVNLAVVSLFLPLPYAIVFVYGGGVASYLLFEWMHLLSHFRSPDRGALTLWVTRRHARHHYIDYHNWYTVSLGGQWIDKIFGSSPKYSEKVDNLRTCGLEPDDDRFIVARLYFGSDTTLGKAGFT